MTRWTFAVVAVALAGALTGPAEAQWKWRDKSGHTQYSDLPPPQSVPEQDILSRPASAKRPTGASAATATAEAASHAASAPTAAASAPLVSRTVDPELEARRKKAEAEQAAKAKAEEAKVAAARAENCKLAQTQMRSLDSGVRIARTNAKGEREFLDDKQRADETRRAREIISADCR